MFRSLFLALVVTALPAVAALHPERLRCELVEDPLGIDIAKPRLSWALSSKERAQSQSAYQILVASNPEALEAEKGDFWDSGKITSAETLHIPYAGQSLKSSQAVWWKVRSWDQDGVASDWSEPATFGIGLLEPGDWGAKWIAQTTDVEAKPAPMLRTEFSIAAPIRRAQVSICGLGYYELRVNGRKIGDRVLDPGYTNFDKRVLFATYDVTKDLMEGRNAIGVVLGNGWFNVQSRAVWLFEKAPWRAAPKLLLRLEIETADGQKQSIVTDESWKTSSGPITFNSLYSGEIYDARLEQKGWDSPGFDDAGWKPAVVVDAPKGRLVAQVMPPIRVTKTLLPARVTEPKPGVFVYDFGQNFSGVPQLKISGPAGTTITMKCGERLNPDGTVDQTENSKFMIKTDPPQLFQTDVYTLKGGGEEIWAPRFTYHGFQYVEVSGAPEALGPDNLAGLVMHTDVPVVGEFSASNPLLGRILEAARWSYLSNLMSIPTDCPQREKNGWTGDAQLASEQGLFNYDAAAVYDKWIDDIGDEVKPDRPLPVIIPDSGWGNHGNALAWDAAFFEIPWNVYLFTGDRRLLEKHFDGFGTYLDRMGAVAKGHIVQESSLGDWLPYNTETPRNLTSTAYYYRDAVIASKAAELLGRKDEARKYTKLATNIKAAFNKEFFDPKTGLYANGSQTAQSAALYFDLAESQDRPAVLKNLIESLAKTDNHLDTGILGSKYVLNALTAEGRSDIALKIASQKTQPSWGWWIEQGATTMWEDWKGEYSRNHIMFGEIAAWFYKALAGINPDPTAPGFRHILIRPNPVGDLTSASARHDSPRGEIVSEWKKDAGEFVLNVTIPANTTATVDLPATKDATMLEGGKPLSGKVVLKDRTADHAIIEIGSGSYSFTVR